LVHGQRVGRAPKGADGLRHRDKEPQAGGHYGEAAEHQSQRPEGRLGFSPQRHCLFRAPGGRGGSNAGKRRAEAVRRVPIWSGARPGASSAPQATRADVLGAGLVGAGLMGVAGFSSTARHRTLRVLWRSGAVGHITRGHRLHDLAVVELSAGAEAEAMAPVGGNAGRRSAGSPPTPWRHIDVLTTCTPIPLTLGVTALRLTALRLAALPTVTSMLAAARRCCALSRHSSASSRMTLRAAATQPDASQPCALGGQRLAASIHLRAALVARLGRAVLLQRDGHSPPCTSLRKPGPQPQTCTSPKGETLSCCVGCRQVCCLPRALSPARSRLRLQAWRRTPQPPCTPAQQPHKPGPAQQLACASLRFDPHRLSRGCPFSVLPGRCHPGPIHASCGARPRVCGCALPPHRLHDAQL
jgi:hypothetical protein